jgi:hypothetical protein
MLYEMRHLGFKQKKPPVSQRLLKSNRKDLGVLLLLLFGGNGYLGSFLNLALLGCAIATMNFKRSTSSKLGWAFKTSHFGLAAYFNLNFFLSSLESQGLGFFVKANELCLESFGRAARKNGAGKRQRSDNSEYFFHIGIVLGC